MKNITFVRNIPTMTGLINDGFNYVVVCGDNAYGFVGRKAAQDFSIDEPVIDLYRERENLRAEIKAAKDKQYAEWAETTARVAAAGHNGDHRLSTKNLDVLRSIRF